MSSLVETFCCFSIRDVLYIQLRPAYDGLCDVWAVFNSGIDHLGVVCVAFGLPNGVSQLEGEVYKFLVAFVSPNGIL